MAVGGRKEAARRSQAKSKIEHVERGGEGRGGEGREGDMYVISWTHSCMH